VRRFLVVTASAAAATYALVIGGAALWARSPTTTRNCPSSGSVILVDTTARVLCLCRAGHVDERFRVALGRGGIDKRATFDGKTPLGRYSLGAAIPSSQFHLFLPVGYPTRDQRERGYSGSAIGVHGPHAAFAWLRHATVWPNWTQGCIAVGTAADVEAIARWVRSTGVNEIVIF